MSDTAIMAAWLRLGVKLVGADPPGVDIILDEVAHGTGYTVEAITAKPTPQECGAMSGNQHTPPKFIPKRAAFDMACWLLKHILKLTNDEVGLIVDRSVSPVSKAISRVNDNADKYTRLTLIGERILARMEVA